MRHRAAVGFGFLIGAAVGVLLVVTVVSRFVAIYVD